VVLATWHLNDSEVGVDLVLTQIFWQLVLPNKSSEVCIKTRSTQVLLPSKGQVTQQTIVKEACLSDYNKEYI